MKKILVTGGTVFVSKYIAEYFSKLGYEVYVLNRNNHPQLGNVTLITADRTKLGSKLENYVFDVVIDVNAYTKSDITCLTSALRNVKDYIFISSSAVYPETLLQPFSESQKTGNNKYWGVYGTNKCEAEEELISRIPNAYILRPAYLYGPMNNIYRESFIFDCAEQDRIFYIPENRNIELQFFHVNDLCKVINTIIEKKPNNQIINLGNESCITICDWVKLCYAVVGKDVQFAFVNGEVNQRNYFCFNDYEYRLSVNRQKILLEKTIPLELGLKESYDWYKINKQSVNMRNYIDYIETHLTTAST